MGTYFILSEYIYHICHVLNYRPNVTLLYLSFQLSFQEVLDSYLTQDTGHNDWHFTGIVLQVMLLMFPSL